MKRHFPAQRSPGKAGPLKGRRKVKVTPESDDLPSFEPSGGGRKGWRDHGRDRAYKTLSRFLASRIGRSWDDVYAEVSFVHDAPHLKEVLASLVVTDAFIEGGQPVHVARYGGGQVSLPTASDTFWVHPLTKLLCYTAKMSARQRREARPVRLQPWRLIDGQHYMSVAGIWYEASRAVTELWLAYSLDRGDVVTLLQGVKRVEISPGPPPVVLERGKQLNYNELRRLGLVNVVMPRVAEDEVIRRAKRRASLRA